MIEITILFGILILLGIIGLLLGEPNPEARKRLIQANKEAYERDPKAYCEEDDRDI